MSPGNVTHIDMNCKYSKQIYKILNTRETYSIKRVLNVDIYLHPENEGVRGRSGFSYSRQES